MTTTPHNYSPGHLADELSASRPRSAIRKMRCQGPANAPHGSAVRRAPVLMGKDALSHQSCFSAVPIATSGPSAAGLIGMVRQGRFAYRSEPDR